VAIFAPFFRFRSHRSCLGRSEERTWPGATATAASLSLPNQTGDYL
jgi:hypothetical protein